MSKLVSVRGHSRKSKTGRLGLVKPHVRTLKGSIALGKASKAEAEILSIKDDLDKHKKEYTEAVKSGDIEKQQKITERVSHLVGRFNRWTDTHGKAVGLTTVAVMAAGLVSVGLGWFLVPLGAFHLLTSAMHESVRRADILEKKRLARVRKKKQVQERKIFG